MAVAAKLRKVKADAGAAGSSFARPAPLRAALLRWFDANKRDLPWRRTRDPYAIWVSEIMLQQTQVSTVIPYYLRFLERFPTAVALAAAPLPEVLGQWRGLGYYSRARNLHLAAQAIARDGMPGTAAGLRELPGLGRYTAAAVASIGFGEPVAVLDGNVARVLARLLALEGPLNVPETEKRLWAEAEALLAPDRPGAFNEAMMELGAMVCTPANPRCGGCPLATACACRRLGLQERIPAPKVRPERKKLDLACAVVERDGAVLLARREEKGLFGGLWELPCTRLERGERAAATLAALGVRALSEEPFAQVRRTLTHRELTMHLVRCAAPKRLLPGYLEQRFVTEPELGQLGLATAMVRALGARASRPPR